MLRGSITPVKVDVSLLSGSYDGVGGEENRVRHNSSP